MDKSDVYIAMCARAEEIQQVWPRAYGDFYLGGQGRVECWLPKHDGHRRIVDGREVRIEDGVVHLAPFVWLPRQDQLIELAQVPHRRYAQTTQDYFDWAKAPYGRSAKPPARLFGSMEQLWLAYVVERRFGRQWEEGEWRPC